MNNSTQQQGASENNGETAVLIDENHRLSHSVLWHMQQDFYSERGTRAWTQDYVPSYPTSNPVIANAYAKVVFSWLRDHVAVSNSSDGMAANLEPYDPIYIVELGAGSGRFAFHFIRQFFNDLDQSAIRNLDVTYVMTDVAESNVEAWKSHPSLQPYIATGRLDFATLDAASDEELRLLHSGDVLSALTVNNPMVVIANYVFDSIPQDVFRVRSGKLFECLAAAYAPNNYTPQKNIGLHDEVEIRYTDVPVEGNSYLDSAYNSILKKYQQEFDDTAFLFPIGALQTLRTFRQISHDRLLVLCADKGYIYPEAIESQPYPKFARHNGCFSFMVNFHALVTYIEALGGQALTNPGLDNTLHIVALLLGDNSGDYQETRLAFQDQITNQSPYDFYLLQTAVWRQYKTLNLEQCFAFLKLSRWDAEIFLDLFDIFLQKLGELTRYKREVYQMIEYVWEGYFYLGESRDIAFSFAKLLAGLEDYASAVYYLKHSIIRYGQRIDTLLYLAMCYSKLQNIDDALEAIQQVQELEPNSAPAKFLRAKLEAGRSGSGNLPTV